MLRLISLGTVEEIIYLRQVYKQVPAIHVKPCFSYLNYFVCEYVCPLRLRVTEYVSSLRCVTSCYNLLVGAIDFYCNGFRSRGIVYVVHFPQECELRLIQFGQLQPITLTKIAHEYHLCIALYCSHYPNELCALTFDVLLMNDCFLENVKNTCS